MTQTTRDSHNNTPLLRDGDMQQAGASTPHHQIMTTEDGRPFRACTPVSPGVNQKPPQTTGNRIGECYALS